MSSINVINIKHPSASSNAITLAADGSAFINTGVLGSRNRIINGNFDVWQRGTSATGVFGGTVYVADRWAFESWSSTAGRVTYDRVSDTPAITTSSGYSQYSARITVTTTTANPSNDFGIFRQFIEGYNVQDLYQRAFTVSFWVKASLTGTYLLSIYGGGTAGGQTPGTPSFTQSYTINSANTWEYKTIAVPACPAGTLANWDFVNGRGLDVMWRLWTNNPSPTGSFGAWNTSTYAVPSGSYANLGGTNGATWQICQVQLEAGSVATPFERRSYGQELSLCQRYGLRVEQQQNSGGITGSGTATTVTRFQFPVTMRAVPTSSLVTAGSWIVGNDYSTNYTASSASIPTANLTVNGGRVQFSGFSTFSGNFFVAGTDAVGTAVLFFSAEL